VDIETTDELSLLLLLLRPRGGRRGREERQGRGREAQLSSILTSSVNKGTVTNNLSMKYQFSSEEVRRRRRRRRNRMKKKRDEEEEEKVKDMKKVKKTCRDGSVTFLPLLQWEIFCS
jgi:hypothetical protein